MRLGFCISGGGRVVEAILEAKKYGLVELDGAHVFLDRDTRFAEIAKQHNVPAVFCRRENGETIEDYRSKLSVKLTSLPVDGLFMTFDWLIPKAVIEKFDPNIVNMHMALLPLFPGRNAVAKAIASGMSVAGVTFHRVDEGMDTGPIAAQVTTPILQDMTESQLGLALFKSAVPLAIQTVRWMERGMLGEAAQNRVYVTGAPLASSRCSPGLDPDIEKFSEVFLAERYPQ